MSQIDVLLQYADKAAALADPALASFARGGIFDQSRVFDNGGSGLQIWNTLQDTSATQTVPGGGTQSVTEHQYQGGYALIVSFPEPSITPGQVNANAASITSWKANASCLLIADRDAANVNNPGFVYYAAAAISSTLGQWRIQPVPAGGNYPFGR